ncbi:MAG: type II secretion system minor pseudopilin GspK [Legionella sp.]
MICNKFFQQGSALLSALFFMTLIAIVATAMTRHIYLDIYRTRIAITSDKLYQASQKTTFWFMGQLLDKKNKFHQQFGNGIVAKFPRNLQDKDSPIAISGCLYDLQSRFNINNLRDSKYHGVFLNLLKTLNINNNISKDLVLNTSIWIKKYQNSRYDDQLLTFYSSQKPPYYPAFQPMHHLSEFRLVKGVTPQIYNKLLPYLTALPDITPININTASKKLMMSLGDTSARDYTNALITQRGEKGIDDLNSINPLIEKENLPMTQLTIDSQYFLAVSNAHEDDRSLTTYTILKRKKSNDGKLTLSLILHSINSF